MTVTLDVYQSAAWSNHIFFSEPKLVRCDSWIIPNFVYFSYWKVSSVLLSAIDWQPPTIYIDNIFSVWHSMLLTKQTDVTVRNAYKWNDIYFLVASVHTHAWWLLNIGLLASRNGHYIGMLILPGCQFQIAFQSISGDLYMKFMRGLSIDRNLFSAKLIQHSAAYADHVVWAWSICHTRHLPYILKVTVYANEVLTGSAGRQFSPNYCIVRPEKSMFCSIVRLLSICIQFSFAFGTSQ